MTARGSTHGHRAVLLAIIIVLGAVAIPISVASLGEVADMSTSSVSTAESADDKWPMFMANAANTGHIDTSGPVKNITDDWFFWTEEMVGSSAAYVNGTVYFGSFDHKVYALDADTGAELWNFTTGDSIISSSPAVVNGTVYIGSTDLKVYALDADTGTELWNFTAGDFDSSPTVVDGTVYIGSRDSNVYAIHANNGTLKWKFSTGQGVDATPAVVNGTVYIGSLDDNMYALDADNGTEQWNFTAGGAISRGPAVANGTVYFGSWDQNVYALDADTGTELWNFTTGDRVFSSPAVVNGIVYIGSHDNNVYALDDDTGVEVWNFTTGDNVQSSPAVVSDAVYVGSRDNNVYVLDADNGTILGDFATGGDVIASPVVVNGTIFIGSFDTKMYALTGETESPELASANFSVTIDSTNSPINETEMLNVTATVENIGDQEGTQTVTLSINGTQRDSTSVTLAPGENQTVLLTWATRDGDAGDYTATVATANDSDSTSVKVIGKAPGNFVVSIDSTNSPINETELLNVTATIENVGGEEDTQTVTLSINGTQRDSTSVTLAPGENQTVLLSWSTSGGDAGDYTATVATANDSDSASVKVLAVAPGNFSVTIVSTNSPINETELLNVSATIENVGDQEATQTVTLSINGTQRDSTSVTLGPGEIQSVLLSWQTGAGDAGDHTATVETANDSDSIVVTVERLEVAPGNFTLAIQSTNSPVNETETLNVTATVENVGDQEATQTITLSLNGTQRDSTSVTLGPGDTQTVDLSWTTSDGDAGDYTATVASSNDSDSTLVKVVDLDMVRDVEIDIKPGSDPNSINNNSRGVIPVAILNTSSVDARAIVVSTLEFGAPDDIDNGGGAAPAHNGHFEDVDGDGDQDLVVHFWTQETGFDTDDSIGIVVGELVDGTSIHGTDSVRIIHGGSGGQRGGEDEKGGSNRNPGNRKGYGTAP